MKKKLALEISLCLIILAMIVVSLFYYSVDYNDILTHWHYYLQLALWLSIFINIIFLYHANRRSKGVDHTDDFFNFPVNFLMSMATVVAIYQISYDVNSSAATDKDSNEHALSLIADEIVVATWETDPMTYPELNALYESTVGHQVADYFNRFKSESEWKKSYPNLPYHFFVDHPTSWHYASKFCQQMVNIIRMFDLQIKLPLGDTYVRDHLLQSQFVGWITTFRLFLKNPIVRQVWETNKTTYVNPSMTAWVNFYIVDYVDSHPDFYRQHRYEWDAAVDTILSTKDHASYRTLK